MYKINDNIILESSEDGLEGYITILDKEILSRENIIEEIKKHFKFGLNQNLLEDLSKIREGKKTLIAEGVHEIDGENGYIEYDFEIKTTLIPKIDENGIVDYRELDSINKVSKNQILATIIRPTDGITGRKITDEIILPKKGKIPKLRLGKNTFFTEDGLKLKASVDGLVECKSRIINVLEILNVDNVDNSIGNIDFNGNVIVGKNVLNGFIIKSKGSVEVRGAVEGGYIKCDGDVLVRRGIQGHTRLSIEAKGNLCTKFIENAQIDVKGNITSESIMHSNVTSRSNIIMIGKNGLIVGGVCRSSYEIIAKVIGSTMATKTVVEVGIDPEITDKKHNLEKELDISETNLEKINKSLIVLERLKRVNKLDASKLKLYNELLNAKESVNIENVRIKSKLDLAKEKLSRLSNGKVRVSDTIYPGSKIIIGDAYLNIKKELHKCTFYLKNGEIRIGSY